MKARWQAWSARFAALSLRERAIVAGALVLGIGLIGYSFGVEPALLKARAATQTVKRVQAELPALQTQLAAMKAQSADPDAASRVRLDALRQQIAAAGQRLAAFEAGMVPPQKMRDFLESLLSRNRNVELLGLKTLPVIQVGAADGKKPVAGETTAPADAGEGIFQHGVEIELAGSYNDLLNYLVELERMPQRVMWSRMELKADKYPRNVLTLRIYTLSLDRKWLVV